MKAVQTILFPTDNSVASRHAFPYAVALANAFDARIIILHIEGVSDNDANGKAPDLTAEAGFDGPLETVRLKLKEEAPYKAILDLSKEKHCDLLVMATEGRSALSQFFLGGSLAEDVVRYSNIPVFVVKVESTGPGETYTARLKEILFTTDLSEPSEQAFINAALFARRFNARLLVLHVVDDDSVEFYKAAEGTDDGMMIDRLREFVTQHIASLPGADAVTSVHVVEGRPETEILRFAETNGIDLIAMATHGHSGIREDLLGSTTDHIIRTSSCPVLAMRG